MPSGTVRGHPLLGNRMVPIPCSTPDFDAFLSLGNGAGNALERDISDNPVTF